MNLRLYVFTSPYIDLTHSNRIYYSHQKHWVPQFRLKTLKLKFITYFHFHYLVGALKSDPSLASLQLVNSSLTSHCHYTVKRMVLPLRSYGEIREKVLQPTPSHPTRKSSLVSQQHTLLASRTSSVRMDGSAFSSLLVSGENWFAHDDLHEYDISYFRK